MLYNTFFGFGFSYPLSYLVLVKTQKGQLQSSLIDSGTPQLSKTILGVYAMKYNVLNIQQYFVYF